MYLCAFGQEYPIYLHNSSSNYYLVTLAFTPKGRELTTLSSCNSVVIEKTYFTAAVNMYSLLCLYSALRQLRYIPSL